MLSRGFTPDVATHHNSLIDELCKNGHALEAIKLFHSIINVFEYGIVTNYCLIDELCKTDYIVIEKGTDDSHKYIVDLSPRIISLTLSLQQ